MAEFVGRVELSPEELEAVARRAAELVLAELEGERVRAAASPFVTVEEAAALLRCKRQRVDDLLSQGRLTRHKDGARTLVSRAELVAHVSPSRPRSLDGNGVGR